MLDVFVPSLLLRIWLTLCFHIVKGNDFCRELLYQPPVTGKALVGHVITTVQVNNADECEIRCYGEPKCLSYNLGPYQAYGHDCEISNSDHVRHPDDLVPMPGYIYRGTKNGCSSSPCFNNPTCLSLTTTTFQCLCPAGFTGINCETGKSCRDIKTAFPHSPDGMYRVHPDGSLRTIWVYCDMTSFDGGWTMCYSTNNTVNPETEVTYDEKLPYGTNGYRTNCNHIQFREILFVDERTGNKAIFTYQLSSSLVPAENYQNKFPGLWVGGGVAVQWNNGYELLICNTDFYSGFFVAGLSWARVRRIYCRKSCTSWCGDYTSPYFRSAATSDDFAGVAFNVNGARPLNSRLVSVGLR